MPGSGSSLSRPSTSSPATPTLVFRRCEPLLGWDPTTPPTLPTPLQTAVLGLLSKLTPFHDPTVRSEEMWPLLLWLLLKLIEPPPAPAAPLSAPAREAPSPHPQTPGRPGGGEGRVGFAERCQTLLHSLLVESASPAAKHAVVEDVLNVSWQLREPKRLPWRARSHPSRGIVPSHPSMDSRR